MVYWSSYYHKLFKRASGGMADTLDLKSNATCKRAGSSPASRIIKVKNHYVRNHIKLNILFFYFLELL